MSDARRLSAALAVAVLAFLLYRATMLPGVDFGDTPSLQATAGSPFITPRDAYPLYFAVSGIVLALARGEPAHALNLASAVAGAAAAGIIVLVAAELCGSIGAGVGTALLFAGSYTFWSQAVIAEVYALHLLFLSLTMLLLLAWERRPTTARLTLFFAVYALGFGNHLSMILLAPAYTLFLLIAAPRGWRAVLAPRVVALALVCAALGALQYAWSLRNLWLLPRPPDGVVDALQRFWFDVTKSDWRETMVLRPPPSMLADRAAMYWFDLRQQFGVAVPLLALGGLAVLGFQSWRRAVLLSGVYLATLAFAYTYNVGDVHVFFLPSHLIVALAVAPAVGLAGRGGGRPLIAAAAAALLVAYGAARIYRDYPAIDRSADHRPTDVLAALTSGLDDERAILLTDLDWQVENALRYFGRVANPNVAHARIADVMLYVPALASGNLAIGRDVALTARARADIEAAYGPLLPTTPDPGVVVATLDSAVRGLDPGTRYVLCILKPPRGVTIDWADVGRALARLGNGEPVPVPDGDYIAIAGVVGQRIARPMARNLPFRQTILLGGLQVQVRMESWLNTDTIRRMGFGHLIAGRRHALIVERGVSFVALSEEGVPLKTAYFANIFATEQRYLIRGGTQIEAEIAEAAGNRISLRAPRSPR